MIIFRYVVYFTNTDEPAIYVYGNHYEFENGYLNIYRWDKEFEDIKMFSAKEDNIAYVINTNIDK